MQVCCRFFSDLIIPKPFYPDPSGWANPSLHLAPASDEFRLRRCRLRWLLHAANISPRSRGKKEELESMPRGIQEMWNPVWGKELEKIKRRNYRREFRNVLQRWSPHRVCSGTCLYLTTQSLVVGCFQKPVTNRWQWYAAQVGTARLQQRNLLALFEMLFFFLSFIFIFLSFKSDFHCFPARSAPPWASREHLRKSLTFEFKTSNYLHCGVEVGKSVEDKEAALWPHSSTESFAEGKAAGGGGGWLESCFVRQ